MDLKELVVMYRQVAGGFGAAAPLAAFGLGAKVTERLFSALDEDYHISRYFHFSDLREAGGDPASAFSINGFEQTHVAIDAEIQEIL